MCGRVLAIASVSRFFAAVFVISLPEKPLFLYFGLDLWKHNALNGLDRERCFQH